MKNGFFAVFAAVLLLTLFITLVQGDTCPDHKTRCSPSQTCCSDTRGGYGCCPYKNGTCCSDGSHCCPAGSTCDIAHSRCIPHAETSTEPEWWTMIYNSFTEEEWLAQNMMEDNGGDGHNSTRAQNKICGGGEQSCPDKYTCCALATGGYGCCPFDGATCCPDKIHCCPNGKTCDQQGRKCV